MEQGKMETIASALDGNQRLDGAASGRRTKYSETATKKRLAVPVRETTTDKERSVQVDEIRKLTANAAEKLRKGSRRRR